MTERVGGPTVILVRTQEEGNIGSTARAMANMGLTDLVLVSPKARIRQVARAFAVGAGDILERAETVDSLEEALAPFRRIVGTTSARARGLPVPVIDPKELPVRLASDPADLPTALVFGPEASGLNNEELALCSLLVRIPCAPRQPTLNLSQAVLLVAWELWSSSDASSEPAGDDLVPATGGEVQGLFDHLVPLFRRIGFARDDTFDAVLKDLRRMAARGRPTSREISLLRGIARRADHALARAGDSEERDPRR